MFDELNLWSLLGNQDTNRYLEWLLCKGLD